MHGSFRAFLSGATARRQPQTHAEKGYTPPPLQPVPRSACLPTAIRPPHLHIPVTGDHCKHRRRFLYSISTARERYEFWMCSKHAYTPYPFSLVPTASHSPHSLLSSSTHRTDDRINAPSLCDGIQQWAKHKKSWLESSGKIGSSCQD